MLTIDNPIVPFFSEIRNGMPRDAEIDITGQATYGQHQFICFELKTIDGIALHVDIRMSKDVIVVNSHHRGSWGHEERYSNSVKPPGPFHLHFECHHHDYKLLINGTSIRFPQRINKSEVNRLEIRGDLLIHRISMRSLEGHIEMLSNSGSPYSLGQGYPSSAPYPVAGGPQNYYPPTQPSYAPQSNAPLGQQGYVPQNPQFGQGYPSQPAQLGQPDPYYNPQLSGQSLPQLQPSYGGPQSGSYEKTPGTDGSYRYS